MPAAIFDEFAIILSTFVYTLDGMGHQTALPLLLTITLSMSAASLTGSSGRALCLSQALACVHREYPTKTGDTCSTLAAT